jgi:hypothetical protein
MAALAANPPMSSPMTMQMNQMSPMGPQMSQMNQMNPQMSSMAQMSSQMPPQMYERRSSLTGMQYHTAFYSCQFIVNVKDMVILCIR